MKKFQKIDFLLIVGFFVFMIISACNSNSDERKSEKLVQGNSGQEDKKIDQADGSFLVDAALLDLKMIQISHIAIEKSTQQSTRDLAQNILSVHEKSYHDLQTIATQFELSIPTVLNETEKIEVENISAASATDFDAKFYVLVTRDHNKYLPHLNQLAQQSANGAIKTWSAEYASTFSDIVAQTAQIAKTKS